MEMSRSRDRYAKDGHANTDDDRYVIVVEHDELALYEYVRQVCAADDRVKVVLLPSLS